ncbi:hypothetical protein J8H63_03030 [Staphylococcus chromogenes]|nr:hypothetical protein [Staphylococcus chromogenes]PNY90313.1 hypothetical protein CD151_11085 [Staphylococcus chromogenes]GGI31825.1 hypothetical protein GCM10008139_11310 [Staphylococcus chromogenes]SUM12937.1 Uncharacterised protein [Staphylococcus chromogenes]
MLKEKESFRLLYKAIKELSVRIGENQLETNSVSLLLLDFDFEHQVFDDNVDMTVYLWGLYF